MPQKPKKFQIGLQSSNNQPEVTEPESRAGFADTHNVVTKLTFLFTRMKSEAGSPRIGRASETQGSPGKCEGESVFRQRAAHPPDAVEIE